MQKLKLGKASKINSLALTVNIKYFNHNKKNTNCILSLAKIIQDLYVVLCVKNDHFFWLLWLLKTCVVGVVVLLPKKNKEAEPADMNNKLEAFRLKTGEGKNW